MEVRLYDLSEDVSDEKIAEFLGKYGEVIEIREQRSGADVDFPGICTGVRIVKMIVKHNIESWVTIDGELTAVGYFGQRNTCRHCRDYVHVGLTCVQNKKLLVQKSYADAAKQMNNPSANAGQMTITASANQNNKTRTPTAFKANATNIVSAQTEVMPPPKPVQQQKLQQPPASSASNEQNLPSGGGSVTAAAVQQPSATSATIRKSASGISDGNETDSSVGSSSSKRHLRTRPPGKKPRVEENHNNGREGGSEAN